MSSHKQKEIQTEQRGNGHDLFIAGGSALVNNKAQPNVLQYHGLFYEHSSLSYLDQTQKHTETYTPLIDHNVAKPSKDCINEHLEYPPSSDSGRHSRGGFFLPKPPLCDYEKRIESGVRQNSVSRPSSAYSVGEALSRPNSAIRKRSSRNESRAYTPSYHTRHNVSPELTIDPDHEPIEDVLHRLGNYTHNFIPDTALAYTDCECTSTEERVPSRLAKVYCSDEEQEEEDSQGVTLDVVFRTFKQYEDKGHTAVRQKAMLTLINTSNFDHSLSENELEKVMTYLVHSVSQVQEACLVLVKQLVKNPSNLQYFLDRDILQFVNKCLISADLSAIRRPALLLAEVIFVCHQFKEKWLEFVNLKLLPKLLSMVRGQIPLDVKYAACCVFRSLTQYKEFIGYATEDILPSVILLRNASAKFKEVYVEILTTVLSHTDIVPPDLVDSSAIPITVSIIREGPCEPQCAALHLLTSLTVNDNGVAIVTGTDSLVPMVLCCMTDSHCRRVKLNALKVMKHLCHSRKIGLCKDLMLQFSGYLLPNVEEESLAYLSQATSKSPSPVKPRLDEERHMWQSLEKFIDLLKDAIFREGKVDTDELGLIVAVDFKPCVDVGQTQLQILTNAFNVLHNICVWPLDKSRLGFSATRINLTGFSDDDKQRLHLSKMNRGLTQTIWDKVGVVASDLLSLYAEKIQKQSTRSVVKSQTNDLSAYFEIEEIQLIKSILEFLLCTSLCTCVAFPDLTPKLDDSPNKKKSKSKLKSSSASNVSPESSCPNTHTKLKSQSDVGRAFRSEEDKLWVKENPHLTQISLSGSGQNTTAVAKSKADLQHKEACSDRRLLRKCLYEAGVLTAVSPFLKCSQPDIQVLVLQILRCLVHPLEERVAPKLMFNAQGSSSRHAGQRPQTAGAIPDTNKKLNMALHKMSPEIAKLINEALVTEEKKEEGKMEPLHVEKKVLNLPDTAGDGLNSIHERLQDYTQATKEEKQKKEEEKKHKDRPVIDRCRPIALQCRESVLLNTGGGVLDGIFSKSQPVKKQSVLLLHDLVQQGELDIHMKLSTHSCIPKLVDFLRVNESNELLEIIGLIIARILVSSDPRLRQLFNRHGGQQLLLSMAQYTSGLIKQEVSTTLKTISKLEMPAKKRPMSAPASRQTQKQKVPDIWDHIQDRWKHEDQVADVLRKWTIEDKKLQRKK